MAQSYAFTKENKGAVDTALDFPRLKLEKKGEKARVAIFSIDKSSGKPELAVPEPEGGYFFDLRVPGAEREYKGAYECLASEAIKDEGGFDPDACPHCRIVLEGNVSEDVMRPRKRKFVMPIIRYKTTGSGELVEPYSVEALAWRFTDRYMNVLIDEHLKWQESGGLLGHDLMLTCEVPSYQTFNISVEPNAAYKSDKALGELVIKTYISQTAGLTNGLIRQLGTSLNAVDLEKKINDTITEAAQLGIGGPPVGSIPQVDQATVEALASDLLGGTGGNAEIIVDEPVVAEVTAPAEKSSSEEIDFDGFFSD